MELEERVESLERQLSDASEHYQALSRELQSLLEGAKQLETDFESLREWVEQHHPRTNNCPQCGARLVKANGKCPRGCKRAPRAPSP